jgi:hypothetical protein
VGWGEWGVGGEGAGIRDGAGRQAEGQGVCPRALPPPPPNAPPGRAKGDKGQLALLDKGLKVGRGEGRGALPGRCRRGGARAQLQPQRARLVPRSGLLQRAAAELHGAHAAARQRALPAGAPLVKVHLRAAGHVDHAGAQGVVRGQRQQRAGHARKGNVKAQGQQRAGGVRLCQRHGLSGAHRQPGHGLGQAQVQEDAHAQQGHYGAQGGGLVELLLQALVLEKVKEPRQAAAARGNLHGRRGARVC